MINKNSQKLIQAAVIGDPISHSSSPKIHNFLLEKHHILGNYQAIKIEKSNLYQGVSELVNQGFAGFNVTIPHKEEIFRICDFTSRTALLTKAVNTVVVTADKKLFGHNSDAEGFINNLKFSQPNFVLKNKTAFVIGAGGAARAIIYSLINAEFKKIVITNRSSEKAKKIIEDFSEFSSQKKCHLLFQKHEQFCENLNECDLLINSTSLGMTGIEFDKSQEIDLKNLNTDAIVYDIVYKPLMTKLLNDAKQRGNKIVTGLGMLVFQALIGFELWFKEKPKEEFVQEILTKLTQENA